MKKWIALLLPMIVISACTTTPLQQGISEHPQWPQRHLVLKGINNWDLVGRLSILNDHESYYLDLDWQQQDDVYRMDLSGPMGIGATRLSGNKSSVTMSSSSEQQVSASSPDSLLYEKTGYRVPIEGLFYWVRGIPDPSTRSVPSFDEQGRLNELEQESWKIRFKGYTKVGMLDLPEKIFIDGYHVKVRLVVDQWKLAASSQQ